MRLVSLSALCIAAFVTVQAQEMFTSSPQTATYCKESCRDSSDWSPDECLELCLDYYESHPLPSQPSYPGSQVTQSSKTSLAKSGNPKQDLLNSLRQSINYLRQDVPSNFYSYCTNLGSWGTFDVRDTDFNGVDQILTEWNLDPRATDFLRNIKFADSASFHSLGYTLQQANGAVEEYVASGTNTDGKIVLAHVHVVSYGTAIYQTDCVRHCHRRLFSKKCRTDCYNRAFTAQELTTIQYGLIGNAYAQLEAKYNEVSNRLTATNNRFSLTPVQNDSAIAEVYGTTSVSKVGDIALALAGYTEILNAVEKTYDLAKKIFGSSTKTEIVESYTKLGFDHYDSVVTIQYYLGVAASNIDRLKSIIVRSLAIPADKVDAFNDYLDFADFMDASSWTNFNNFLRTDNEGGSKTAQIFFNRDDATNKYNVFVTDIKADFKVADDVFVMKRSKSRMGGMFQKEDIIF